jgi:hypothetical protein
MDADARAVSAHGSNAERARNERREIDMAQIVLPNEWNFITKVDHARVSPADLKPRRLAYNGQRP